MSQNTDKQIITRYDSIKLDESFKMTKTDEGFLKGRAIITRTGIFKYQRSDGSIYNELRTPEEVFANDSIESFKLKPITNDHPQEKVNADNVKKYQVGNIGDDVKRDGDHLTASIIVTDSAAIADVEGGKKELSLGYQVALIKEDGNFNGQDYQFKQTNIRGNHLAIVYQGRAGHQARLNLDSQDAFCVNINNNNKKDMSDKDKNDLEKSQFKIDSLESDNKALKESVGDLKIRHDKLEGERDALKAKLEEANKKDHSVDVNKLVKARLDLEKKAGLILKDEMKDDMSDKDIRLAVIKKLSPEFEGKDREDSYIEARFDTIIEIHTDEKIKEQFTFMGTKLDGDQKKDKKDVTRTQSQVIGDRAKGIK